MLVVFGFPAKHNVVKFAFAFQCPQVPDLRAYHDMCPKFQSQANQSSEWLLLISFSPVNQLNNLYPYDLDIETVPYVQIFFPFMSLQLQVLFQLI